ncbi:MAG: bifunctional riboflavin kinase/FAD synthetase [Chloroflexi bacterium]|nr:MAG: bifunctional riboflavin kinase/FAD synthetase [Chloroflexota bacterium]
MRVVRDLTVLQPEVDTFLAIGKFDGVHLGHHHLLEPMIKAAQAAGAQSAVITLHPNPLEVLAPDRRVEYLTTLDERVRRLGDLGLDVVVVQRFDEAVAQTSARRFMRTITKHLRVRQLWAGPGFALGRGREGNVDFLHALGEELGYTVQVVEPLVIGGEVVSGTRIRALLREGHVGEASVLMGRLPTLSGEVVAGASRGHKLGYPTANLKTSEKLVVPANGIYAVRVYLEGETLDGVASIGVRPTFEKAGERKVEVHIFDFQHNIYGRRLTLEFVRRLRDEKKFDSVEALVAQMDQDAANARAILASQPMPMTTTNPGNFEFEEIEHTADIGLRVRGKDLADLFVNAARGMWTLIVPDIGSVKPVVTREIELEAMDLEVLLVDWLSELLYLHETEHEAYSQFVIHEISPTHLRAEARGGPLNGHTLRKHIKAVTFNDLSIEKTADGYTATVVFDV